MLLLPLFLTGVLASQPVPTHTIIDVLSSKPEFSEILHLIQTHGLVPFINEQYNATFLAPVNSAFVGINKDSVTKDQLLYHLIHGSVYSSDISQASVYETYLKSPISLSLKEGVNHDVMFDETDLLASPKRGLVHGLQELLAVPLPVSDFLYASNEFEEYGDLIDLSNNDGEGNLLFFGPLNSDLMNWLRGDDHNLEKPVLNYLQNSAGRDDRQRLIGRHVAELKLPLTLPTELELADGMHAKLYEDKLVVNGTQIQAATRLMVAKDGLFLGLRGVAAPPAKEFFKLTPSKVALGLGGHALVRALELYGYGDLISNEFNGTVVVPSAHRQVGGESVLYHLMSSFPNVEHALLDSLMPLRGGELPQRLHFERRAHGGASLNWESLGSEFYTLGNTSFYKAHDPLTPPPSLAMALGPMLVSSYSLTFLDKLDRLQLPHNNSWTVLVPNREAWEKNLLLKMYLDRNITALEHVFDSLILRAPVYSDSGRVSTLQYGNVDVKVEFESDRKLEVCSNEFGGCQHIQTEVCDALFNNGVAHVVGDVPLPIDLEVSTRDLIIAGNRAQFVQLLLKAGMASVLEPAANFTVLVPPIKDLVRNNYTTETRPERLREMLELHLLPGNPLEQLFKGEEAQTLAGEALEAHNIGTSEMLGLTPKSATEGQRVLLYKFGFTNGNVAKGSSVVFIDRHISPKWILPVRFGLRKGTYAIFGVLLGLFTACAIGFGLVLLVTRRASPPQLPED